MTRAGNSHPHEHPHRHDYPHANEHSHSDEHSHADENADTYPYSNECTRDTNHHAHADQHSHADHHSHPPSLAPRRERAHPTQTLIPTLPAVRGFAVGDSVMLGAARELQRVMPGLTVDAKVSRQLSAAIGDFAPAPPRGDIRSVRHCAYRRQRLHQARPFDELLQLVKDVPRVIVFNLKEPRRLGRQRTTSSLPIRCAIILTPCWSIGMPPAAATRNISARTAFTSEQWARALTRSSSLSNFKPLPLTTSERHLDKSRDQAADCEAISHGLFEANLMTLTEADTTCCSARTLRVGLVVVSLFVLLAIVFTASRSEPPPAAPRFERLGPQNEAAEQEAREPLNAGRAAA